MDGVVVTHFVPSLWPGTQHPTTRLLDGQPGLAQSSLQIVVKIVLSGLLAWKRCEVGRKIGHVLIAEVFNVINHHFVFIYPLTGFESLELFDLSGLVHSGKRGCIFITQAVVTVAIGTVRRQFRTPGRVATGLDAAGGQHQNENNSDNQFFA
jgi:hypothetical protein